MGWFNYYGLIFMVVIIIPNIIYAIKHQSKSMVNQNPVVEAIEQIGRYGCMIFMIFNVPYTYFNFWFTSLWYLIVNGVLAAAYCLAWVVFWKKKHLAKVLTLSILPSVMFLFSGIMLLNIPLIFCSILFAFAHIFISVKQQEHFTST